MIKYVFYCILYGTMLMFMSIITKLNEQLFSYSPLFVTLFYMSIFYPINIIRYAYSYDIRNIFKMDIKHFKIMSIPAIVYTIETVFSYWALLYVPISFYIMGRTSTAFVNVFFAKCYLHKPIHKYYYVGLAFLFCSYILFLTAYSKNQLNTNEILSVCVVFLSAITTALYNNMTEKFFDDINIENSLISIQNEFDYSEDIEMGLINEKDTQLNRNHHNVSEMQMIYQLIFNVYGFILITPIALALALRDNQFISNPFPNILYSITGIFFQTNIALKIIILSSSIYSGNQILTGVDLARRIITNLIAYLWFGDYWNVEIIFANILMVAGCCFIAFGAVKNST